MSKMLEHLPVFCQHLVQHRLAIILVSAPQDVMMGAGHHLYGVQLHKSQVPDQRDRIELPCRRASQVVRSQPEVSGVAI